MKKGDRVARTSIRTENDGIWNSKIGEQGTIERVFEDNGQAFGFNVVWDSQPKAAQYVSRVRIAPLEDYLKSEPVRATVSA